MKYKNFLIRLFDLILVLGLLAGYQAVIYSRDKEATIAELKSQVNQLQGEKEDILEAAKNSGKLGTVVRYFNDNVLTGCGNGCGNDSCLWIILLLCCCGGWGNNGFGCGGCGNGCNCGGC